MKTLPKPEEVPKQPKFWRSPGPKTSGTLVFFGLFGTSSGFGKKGFVFFGTSSSFGTILLPKPEERKIHPKMRDPAMKDFFLISNQNSKGNSYRGKKSRNDGFL